MNTELCPECGHEMNSQGKTTLRFAACGKQYLVETTCILCPCGLAEHELDDIETMELAVADQLLKRDRVDGDALKWCRKSLGMTKSELASLLHSTEENVCAYEAGLVPVPVEARMTVHGLISAARALRSWTPVVTIS